MITYKPKKERVTQIGGDMGDFGFESEQELENRPKGPQILGSITFSLPDFDPVVSEVVDSFYGLFRDDVFGQTKLQPEDTNAQAILAKKKLQQETASMARNHFQSMEADSQRLSMQKQEELMRAALRMSGDTVTIVDVITAITPNTNPIQAQREKARMEALGISDVATVVNKVEVRNAQVEDAENDQSLHAAKQASAIATSHEGGSGQVGSGKANLSFQAAG